MTRPHTDWCARGHQCGLGEHRSDPIVVDLPAQGRGVLVRVQGADGREHAEVRLRIALAPGDTAARRQLLAILTDVRELVTRAALAQQPHPHRYR